MNIFRQKSQPNRATRQPVALNETMPAKDLPQTVRFKQRFDLYLFYDSMAKMVNSGLSYTDAIEILCRNESPQEAHFTKVCHTFADLVMAGKSPSGCMALMSKVFPKYAQRIMYAGEQSGHSEEIFLMLAEDEKKAMVLRRKLLTAVFYPALALCVTVLVCLGTWGFLKQMLPVFEALHVEVPWHLKLMMAGFQLLPYVVGTGALVAWAVVRERQQHTQAANSKLVQSWRKKWRSLPGLKTLSNLAANVRFCELLALQLEAGVPQLRAVDSSLLASNDPFLEEESDAWHREQNPSERRRLKRMAKWGLEFQERLKKAWERFSKQKAAHTVCARLSEGATLLESLKESGLIHPVALSFVESGEETSKLPESLHRAAAHLQAEFDYKLESMNAVLEPLILLLVGGFVGFLMLSVFVPLTEILNKL